MQNVGRKEAYVEVHVYAGGRAKGAYGLIHLRPGALSYFTVEVELSNKGFAQPFSYHVVVKQVERALYFLPQFSWDFINDHDVSGEELLEAGLIDEWTLKLMELRAFKGSDGEA